MSRMLTYKERDAQGNVTSQATMKCDCGKVLEMEDHHDIDCPRCHRSYNSAGQLLADRSQWGEETGETAQDYDAGLADGERYRWTQEEDR